ncbi:carbohydrate kinase [Acidaminobacter sp. JC074]|uniref:carbohydrate kinase family protein n=1 Tax=Acidaminobacter sp. JC074 TaxID=2530199 RepID=UPI001F0D81AA|nr:carbohydrate kinase [Acidaminobacter sp. JC074]MCH4888059.1 carbohydrate kinase [Acidaminobacter sp. JC074]
MIDILAVGELLIDFTPVKTDSVKCFQPNPGGAPCNMLAMASSMGASTAFVGKVGNDQFGKTLRQTLVDAGINVDGLTLSDETPTTLAFVHLTDDGDRSFSFYRKGCADVMLSKEDIPYDLVDQAKVIHFGSLSFTDEPSKSTVLELLDYAKSKGKLISYDPNYRPALWPSKEAAVEGMMLGIKYADMIKVSDEEAVLLTGESDYKKAAKKLYDMGIKLVTVTLGEAGSLYYHESSTGIVEGFKSQVKDTTGAGDSFFGATVSEILKVGFDNLDKNSIRQALKTGNAAASLVIEGYGGIPSIPKKALVEKRKL